MNCFEIENLSLLNNKSEPMTKDDLINLIEEKHSAPFLFLGSGFSKHFLNTPKWDELLQNFAHNHINSYYTRLETRDLCVIAKDVAKEKNDSFWKLPDDDSYKNKIQDKVDSSSFVLKYEISEYLKQYTLTGIEPKYKEEIELLTKINIDGIITTNWDDLAELLFPKFTTYVGQEELIFAPTYNVGEIYKIHGCIHNPSSIVLTSDDYEKYNEKNTYLAAKLTTIFIEHPIIFLGYSIRDKNIQQILSSIVKCLNDVSIHKLQNNLVFIEWNEGESDLFSVEKYDIMMENEIMLPVTRIITNNYKTVFECLQSFKREIPAHLLRIYKKNFYKIIYSENPEKQLCVIDEKKIDTNKEIQFVCGFGAINKYKSAIGYIGLKSINIFKDILFDDGNYEAEKIIINTLPDLRKNTNFIPCYKYLRAVGITDSDSFRNNRLGINFELINDFRCSYSDPAGYINDKTVENVIEENPSWKAVIYLTYMDISNNDLPIILDFCKKYYNDFLIKKEKPNYSSHFKKLICMYDWKKYGW
ncbi:SIR2 family protein [uncultured Bacteroides sp.]|uniref:SIR2 family protein n=1 Tax=uncultured Bacteroides sp. TaxID=162156 RepID=UPI002AAAFB74|nr:SIR2 family protein [uncultured Bacteroides sp.]